MNTMSRCQGADCGQVPDEVFEVVDLSMEQVSSAPDTAQLRKKRAEVAAFFMALQGWRFCECFALGHTEQHSRVSDLLDTQLANRLANMAALTKAA